jgi:ubiquinone/menaquinone biosynthesis C-methylase UbiE
MWRVGSRRVGHELMDEADPHESAPALRDIARINSGFGGHAIVRKLLKRAVSRDQTFTLLDVGAASGDTARVVMQEFPQARVTSLDYKPFHLREAPEPRVSADAFALPFLPRSFDFVFCSLFLHHFDNESVVQLLSNFATVARTAVLVSDLERHPLAYWFMPATRWLFRWHWLSVHDGKLSVRAAFTKQELATLAERAGMKLLSVERHRPAFRISLHASVNDHR